jgi:3-oxoacyl-[acyl-carrier protein] reductase
MQLGADLGAEDALVALVTGAGGGLGPACCEALAAGGFHVLAADLDERAAERAAAAVPSASARQLDVTCRDQVESVVGAVVEQHGGLHCVVNLAGIARNQVLHKIDDDAFDLVMRTHLYGTLNTMRAAAPVMKRAGYGRIVNVSSVAVRGSVAGGAYGAAKGAIEALTRSAAIELAPSNVTVNCVAPGLVAAGIFLTTPADYRRERIGKVPMGRAASVTEIADTIAFFASRQASYITGQTLFVCGGLTIGI